MAKVKYEIEKIQKEILSMRDPMLLPEMAEKVKLLSVKQIEHDYDYLIGVSIMSWAWRCLLSYELYRRKMPFIEIAKKFGISRQSAWREAIIFETIIIKKPQLLEEPYLSKTWFKRVIEANVEDPVKELDKIADERERIFTDNLKRKEKGLEPLEQLSTRRYMKIKGKTKYTCEACGSEVKEYKKVCKICVIKLLDLLEEKYKLEKKKDLSLEEVEEFKNKVDKETEIVRNMFDKIK